MEFRFYIAIQIIFAVFCIFPSPERLIKKKHDISILTAFLIFILGAIVDVILYSPIKQVFMYSIVVLASFFLIYKERIKFYYISIYIFGYMWFIFIDEKFHLHSMLYFSIGLLIFSIAYDFLLRKSIKQT